MQSSKDKYQEYLKASLVRGPKHFEYEDYAIPIDNDQMNRYEVVEKIGRGKYSDVYRAMRYQGQGQPDKPSVLKILKPVRQAKIRREIKILKTLNHPSIIELEAVLFDDCSKSFILAMDFVKQVKSFNFSDEQTRLYTYKIVQGLNYCHSQGIMHRDIKPLNVLIDPQKQKLKIIDWGLADYYLPSKEYNLKVASRYYKGPELLLNNKYYDYSLDMWSLGCMFAGMIFKKSVMFRGDDNSDQLRKIMEVIGNEQIEQYVNKYSLKPEPRVAEYIRHKKCPKIPFEDFVTADNQHLANLQALSFLKRLLRIDHDQRITAFEALQHQYFEPIRHLL